MHPASNLPPNPGPFNPAGSQFLKPPIGTHGIPGLPVALGGVPPPSAVRSNGMHPAQPLPTPPPLVSVPLAVPPSSLPPIIPTVHRGTAAVTTVTNSRPHITSATPSLTQLSSGAQQQATPPPHLGALQSLQRRPRSPEQDKRSPSPKRARSRSRSPLVQEDPDSDNEPPRSPEPEATILDQECHRSRNAIFIKHLSRGWNSCSRCDFEFKPTPESSLLKKKDDKPSHKPLVSPIAKELERKEERKEEDRDKMKSVSPHITKTADPPTSSSASSSLPISSPQLSSSAYPTGCLTPPGRSSAYQGVGPHDPTPALRTLSDYARPHLLSDPSRSIPYTLPSLPQHPLDPYYRMAAMYPPGSRERLELELDREKRERDARERELRERELREMELREKMKHELEMKPPGFERLLPPGANPMDPYWTELLKRYAAIPGAQPTAPQAAPPGHMPGIYPPANLSSDLIARERERLERLGEAARAASSDPLRSANAAIYEYYQRISYEQIVLHRQMAHQAGFKFSGDPTAAAASSDPARMAEFARLAQNFARADPLSSASANPLGGIHGAHPVLPGQPGQSVSDIVRQTEAVYRDLLSRPPYSTDPVLAHQLQLSMGAQQEALIQRHLLVERERERLSSVSASASAPPHLPR